MDLIRVDLIRVVQIRVDKGWTTLPKGGPNKGGPNKGGRRVDHPSEGWMIAG